MKLMKKIMAAVVVAATVATVSMATLSVSAADIAYNSSGTDAYNIDDDGVSFRVNIYNTFGGNKVTDINPSGSFEKKVNVTFTISGLKRNTNVDDMGNPTDGYCAYLAGIVGAYTFWKPGDASNTTTNDTVSITGNGTYTVSFNLKDDGSDSISCLILQTNINIYQNGVNSATAGNCGITCTIDSITTGEDATTPADNTTPTDGTTTAPDTEKKPDETTTAAAGETTTTAAGGNDSSNGGSSNSGNNSSSGGSSSSNNSKSGTNNAKTSQTGDFGIAAVALGAVATAALGVGAYTITRKKK